MDKSDELMSTHYSGPPTNGVPFPGPPGGKAPPHMMGRPPFSGPPKFSGPPPTFNGKPMGPPSFSGPTGGPPSMGPPSSGPPRGPPSSVGPPTSFQPPPSSQPPTSQMQGMSVQDNQPPKAPSPASNLFGAAPPSNNFFDKQAPPPNAGPPPPSSAPGPFGPPSSNPSPFAPPASSTPNPGPFGPPSSAPSPFYAPPSTSTPAAAPPVSNPSPFSGPPPPVSNPAAANPSPFAAAPPSSNASPFGTFPSSNSPGQPPVSNPSPFGPPSSNPPGPFGAAHPSSAASPFGPQSSNPGPPRPPATSNSSPFAPSPGGAPSFPPRSQGPAQPSPPQPGQAPFGQPPTSNTSPFGNPPGPPTSNVPPQRPPNQPSPFGPPMSQPPMSAPSGFGPPPTSQPPMSAPSGFGPTSNRPPTSNGPAFPPTNNLNAYSQPTSFSPGLQGISSGPGSQPPPGPPMFSRPPGPPGSYSGPQGPPGPMELPAPEIGPPPSMNGPPPTRGYSGSTASSGPRRPYPSNMSYGVNSPASLTGPPMPPPPGSQGPGARHPSAPVIANPGAGLAGQLPSIPQPAPQQPPAKSRIDPDLMPNPLDVQKVDQGQYEGKHWVTTTPGVPPLVSTNVPLLDMGNCTPRFIRSAFYTIPANKELANQMNMPISFAVQPCARLGPGEAALATIDMSVLGGPLRCRRCKAYINPNVKFVDGGRKFICNLCGVDTEVPPEYFCNLDHTGRRADTAERPELSRGSYEFLTTTDYCKGSTFPQSAAYIFVIDVSYSSFQSGMVQTLTSNILAVLNNLPKEEGQEKSPIRVGFITYNTQLHFYNLNPKLAQPAMLVQPDMTEVFVPIVDGFLVTVDEAQAHLKALMELIPAIHGQEKKAECVMLPAIQAGCAALKAANRPGKVIMFHSSLPVAPGPGQLKNREDKKLLNTDKEATLLVPADPVFEKVARECVDAGVGVDMFLFPHAYIDVASVGKIATVTGGVIQRYPMFRADVDGERLIQDLAMHIAEPCVFDAVLRMRTNAGIRPVEFCGNFMMQNATDMEIAVLKPTSCVTIEIKHDDKLCEDFQAYVQVALLYTSMSGVRKLRLHNLALPVSSNLADLYKSCDMDTVVNSLTKEFGKALVSNHSYKNLKEQLLQRVSNSLACYRQNCAAPSQPGQLILPETLKLLPLYSHCLLRSPALMPSVEVSFDEKSNLLQRLAMMTVEETELFLYPRLYNLNTSTLGNEGMPPIIRSSYERIRESGAHLLDNGLVLILWVGANTPSKWLQEVMGVTVLDQVDPTVGNLQPFDNATSIRIRGIIDEIRAKRKQHLRLNVVRQKDKTEHIFMQFLVEDKTEQGMNYTDFLCSIHREIRNILS